MSIFGTIKAAAGRGESRIEEQIEKEKRKAAEQSETKALERQRYYELVGGKDAWKDPAAAKSRGGLSPSEALMQIERERKQRTEQTPRAERYQKIYPGRKELKPKAPKQTSKKAMVFGALKTIASNVQANVASGRAGVGGTFKQPDMGMGFSSPSAGMGFGDFGFGTKPGYNMFGMPIGKPKREGHKKKGKGKGRGRDIVIHLR